MFAVVNFPHSLSASGFGEKEYTYKTYESELKRGDIVVVETQTGLSVARFVRYLDSTDIQNLKYIVQRVNTEKHQRIKAIHECDDEGLLD